jgi:hypothetical protein
VFELNIKIRRVTVIMSMCIPQEVRRHMQSVTVLKYLPEFDLWPATVVTKVAWIFPTVSSICRNMCRSLCIVPVVNVSRKHCCG